LGKTLAAGESPRQELGPKKAEEALIAELMPLKEHVAGHSDKMFAAVCQFWLEEIVSKKLDAPYRSRPSNNMDQGQKSESVGSHAGPSKERSDTATLWLTSSRLADSPCGNAEAVVCRLFKVSWSGY
jgi:hypothetical protein